MHALLLLIYLVAATSQYTLITIAKERLMMHMEGMSNLDMQA